ncbi:SpoIIE family protein phosphatase [Streptomyces sp. NPDC002896]|uniref:PP2C family protein-serine/threonine phosphatase n=1 Tax=Streptomyces sp. NPDC002896 TaxID=3154438 RepID=UPI0033214ED3
MRESGIDYEGVFQALPSAVLLLDPDLVIAEANPAYERVSGRPRDRLVGRHVFDMFPDNPADPAASGTRNLRASLQRVAATGERDSMALQRWDVQVPDRPGVFEERYWSTVNTPVLDQDGKVVLIVHRVEEVTELVRARGQGGGGDRQRLMEADLFTRAGELQEVNERLREAHERERGVALALQRAMLPPPKQIRRHGAAVRYRPAVGALNVCGDWYDLVDLEEGRIAVTVGDVVGHGLEAACVMGQLRSALCAAVPVADGPAEALDALGLYARSVEGAESTTAVLAAIDRKAGTITYSSAGHPPPAVLDPGGAVRFLDAATDPPLGARLEHLPRPQARTHYADGSVLVLYTDGLVERRGEDIYTGLGRLADCLTRHRTLGAEELADALLTDLLPCSGNTDDTALVILRL